MPLADYDLEGDGDGAAIPMSEGDDDPTDSKEAAMERKFAEGDAQQEIACGSDQSGGSSSVRECGESARKKRLTLTRTWP